MNIKRVVWPLVVLTLVSSLPAYSYLMSGFNTLDQQLERSDAIAVVRVEHLDDASAPEGATRHYWHVGPEPTYCYVQEVLKGQIIPKKKITIDLLAPENHLYFDTDSTYLVFLTKKSDAQGNITYESFNSEDAVIEVSSQERVLPTKGTTTKDKIQTLIRNYIKQRDERLKRENVLLNKMLK